MENRPKKKPIDLIREAIQRKHLFEEDIFLCITYETDSSKKIFSLGCSALLSSHLRKSLSAIRATLTHFMHKPFSISTISKNNPVSTRLKQQEGSWVKGVLLSTIGRHTLEGFCGILLIWKKGDRDYLTKGLS